MNWSSRRRFTPVSDGEVAFESHLRLPDSPGRYTKPSIPMIATKYSFNKWTLDPKHIQHLDEVSHIELGFPLDFLRRKEVHEFLHGGLFERIQL